MKITEPNVAAALLPLESRQIIIAKDDPDYQPLPCVRTSNGQVITRWRPSADERAALMSGEDIYVTLLAFGAINPFSVTIGQVNWSEQPTPERARHLRVPDDLMIACRALLDAPHHDHFATRLGDEEYAALQDIRRALTALEAT